MTAQIHLLDRENMKDEKGIETIIKPKHKKCNKTHFQNKPQKYW